ASPPADIGAAYGNATARRPPRDDPGSPILPRTPPRRRLRSHRPGAGGRCRRAGLGSVLAATARGIRGHLRRVGRRRL
ncbi:MAG: hypothetical protein AVDCRST_MAG73-2490, partial [uncultured Thermomicrobiales bacterium]